MKRAIIFSNNKKLCRLVEIELMLCGYTVSVKRSADVSSLSKPYDKTYDCLIYDNTEQRSDESECRLPIASVSIAITGQQAICVDNDFDVILEYPFSLDDLRAAISDNQTYSLAETQSTPKEKIFYLDENTKTVIYNGIAISLSEYELIALTLLCQKNGEYLSREELSDAFGGTRGNIGEVYVCHLRRKLEIPFGTKVIYTARGKGYYTDHVIRYLES